MTTAELAAEWNVSRRTVIRWIDSGKLAAVKLPGGHMRIRRTDAEAALTPSDQASA